MSINEVHLQGFYNLISSLKTPEDCALLFEDLCTYKEVEQMALRAKAARLFLEGKTYTEIIGETELSSATLSRISRCISHGAGGYRKVIEGGKK